MDEKGNKLPSNSSSKDLLYSELLGSSFADHIREIMRKKKKSHTFTVQRSQALERASKLLMVIDQDDENVQNIEIVEEGKPVIDMSVTLIEKEDEDQLVSDVEAECDDSEPESNHKKVTVLNSDSDCNPSEEEIDEATHKDKNTFLSSDLEKEQFEYDSAGECYESDSESEYELNSESEQCESNSESELYESNSESEQGESNSNSDKLVKYIFKSLSKSSNTDYKVSGNKSKRSSLQNETLPLCRNSHKEKLKSEISELKETKLSISPDAKNEECENENETLLKNNSNELLEASDMQSRCVEIINVIERKYMECPKADFRLADSPCPNSNNQSTEYKLSLSAETKRKLISVLDDKDEQNLLLSKKQKTISGSLSS